MSTKPVSFSSPSLRPAFAILALAALVLIAGTWLILRTVAEERSQRLSAINGVQIANALDDLARDAVNAETGQRGYFITLDQRYLAPYRVANGRYRADIERLKSLYVSDTAFHSPAEHDLVADIEATFEVKFRELRETLVQLDRFDVLAARSRMLSFEGEAAMERLNSQIGQLRKLQQERIDSSNARLLEAEAALVPELGALLALIAMCFGMAMWLLRRTADAEGRAANASALAEARDRADLLAQEMNHRVKNLLAMVLALITMSSRSAPESSPLIQTITERVRALLRSHEATQGAGGNGTASVGKLVETVIAPYRSESTLCNITGPEVALQTQQAVSLGLMLHEMATNAIKYGAWSIPGGTIDIDWQIGAEIPRELHIVWRERAPGLALPISDGDAKPGFGSTLLNGSARQLGGSYERIRHDDGMEIKIRIALDRAAAM